MEARRIILRAARYTPLLVGVALWLQLGGPPAPLLAAPLYHYTPQGYAGILVMYAVLSFVWGAAPTPASILLALLPALAPPPRDRLERLHAATLAWAPLYAAIYTAALLAASYLYTVYTRLVSWNGWPPAIRVIIESLGQSKLFNIAAATLIILVLLRVTRSMIAPLAYAASSPRAAARLAAEWVRAEAERIRGLRAWHHRVFTLSLSMLTALPIALIVNALIGSIYSGLEVIATPRIRELLGFARGAISTATFFATTRVVSGGVKRSLTPHAPSYPKPLYALIPLVFMLVLTALLAGPGYLLEAFSCLAGCTPTPTRIDVDIADVMRGAAEWLEESEQLLRFLVKLLWS